MLQEIPSSEGMTVDKREEVNGRYLSFADSKVLV
jgi:hypothetical protein